MKNQVLKNANLKTVNDSYTVYTYTNGYMVEVSGNDADDDWKTVKIICNSLQDLQELITDIAALPLNG